MGLFVYRIFSVYTQIRTYTSRLSHPLSQRRYCVISRAIELAYILEGHRLITCCIVFEKFSRSFMIVEIMVANFTGRKTLNWPEESHHFDILRLSTK